MKAPVTCIFTDREAGLVIASLLERRYSAENAKRNVGPPWKAYWHRRAQAAQALIQKIRAARKGDRA